MDDNRNWDELPSELLLLILYKLSSAEDIQRFSAVSKSWKSVLSGLSEDEKPLLPPESPILFLAEQVVEGGALSLDFNDEYEEGLEEDDEDHDDYWDDFDPYLNWYDHRKNSVGTTRGLYRLATGKTCNIALPEASGKLVLGTNKGWLLTLGIDLEINLLHPLSRKQIALPPVGTFPIHDDPSIDFDQCIRKVAMSSMVQPKTKPVADNGTYLPKPIVMIIYDLRDCLGFARLGDKVWTNIEEIPISIQDIAYYRGKFYAVDSHGDVFVCDIDNDYNNGGRARGTKIASCPVERHVDFTQRYLVESGSCLWLVVRFCKFKYFKPPGHSRIKYRTAGFTVWKLEPELYSDDRTRPPSCTCTRTNNLGDEALFVGKATCLSLPSSEYIKPNCIYFTDDTWEVSHRMGGGHDMGIFNMESSTIEPFFNGKSIHPISPPLWYI